MQALRNKKGAGTLIFFLILFPVILLLGAIAIDFMMFAMVRAHLQNILDSAVISAVNLSVKDEYRSDRELVIFRTSDFDSDFRAFTSNFHIILQSNLFGLQGGTSVFAGTICTMTYSDNHLIKLPISGTITVTIKIEDSEDSNPGVNATDNLTVDCKFDGINLSIMTNIAGFFGFNDPVKVKDVVLSTKVGNIRVLQRVGESGG